MRFENWISNKQFLSIIVIVVACFLLSVHQENAYSSLRLVATVMIIISVVAFWKEAAKRYKIIMPYKKNYYDSKAEQIIADYFKRKNIIFNHHPQIKVPKPFWIFSVPFVDIRLEPDFFLPEFDVFVEYWGKIDDPEYKKNSYDRKKKLYADNNIEFISLYPKNLGNLDFVFTSKLLDLMKNRDGNLRKCR